VQRGKLDALLTLCEAHDCRRVRLLGYFGEHSTNCGNCDNCLTPPQTWDATDAARKLLSCVYRMQQMSGIGYGAGHLIDVLRGKLTDKVQQHGHERLSTFGVGADLDEGRWRAVLRQLVALGYVVTEGDYNTLALAGDARDVLRGGVSLQLKLPAEPVPRRTRTPRRGTAPAVPVDLDREAQARFVALKAWRTEVAREHALPAYVIFHDATLAEMARRAPATLDELGLISGVGAKKLDAYGAQLLRVLEAPLAG
jgi:ATP-dependent DNA helicase RecQ